jgi:aminoglycoside N3'-acetyltransferase
MSEYRSRAELADAFAGIIDGAELVELHTAARAIGAVIGGIDTIVDGLLDGLGAQKTLLVPTFTGHLIDPASWSNPPAPPEQWDRIRAALPAFDPRVTTPRQMGRVADLIFRRPGAVRSDHPAESVAAVGPRAEWLVRPHPIDDPMGARSPWARLYEANARVALVGVGLTNCSLLHFAEQRAAAPYLERAAYAVPVTVPSEDGTLARRWVEVVGGGGCSAGFDNIRTRLEGESVLGRAQLGDATVLVADARPLVDATCALLRENPHALLCALGRCEVCDEARMA